MIQIAGLAYEIDSSYILISVNSTVMLDLLNLPRDVVIIIATYLPPNDRDSFCATCASLYALRQEKRVWECPPLLPILNELLITSRERFIYWYTIIQRRVCRGSERFLPPSECLIRSVKRVDPILFAYFLRFTSVPSRAIYFIAKRGSLPLYEMMMQTITHATSYSVLSNFLSNLVGGIVASPSPNLSMLDRYFSTVHTADQIEYHLESMLVKAVETDHIDILKHILSTYTEYTEDIDAPHDPHYFYGLARGGYAQKIDQMLTSAPNNDSLHSAIDGAVECGRIDLFDSLVARLPEVPLGLLESWIDTTAEEGHIKMMEHLRQKFSHYYVNPYCLIQGLAKSSPDFQHGLDILSKTLISQPPTNEIHCFYLAIDRSLLAVIQLLLSLEFRLSNTERINLIQHALIRGDIEIIDFLMNLWSSMIHWDDDSVKRTGVVSGNSGSPLIVKYFFHQMLIPKLVPDIVEMMKHSIQNGYLPLCQYLRRYLPILTGKEVTDIMNVTLLQNSVPISKYVLTFLPLDQLDIPYLLKRAISYSCNETLDLLLELLQEKHIPNPEELSPDLSLSLNEESNNMSRHNYHSFDKMRVQSRHHRIFGFIDKPMRRASPFRLCSGITKQKRLCHRRVTKRKYCSSHADQEVMES